LLRLAEIAEDDSSFVEQQALQSWSEVARQEDNAIYLDKRKACALPIALQRQLIRLAIGELLGDTRDIEAGHIEAVRGLLAKPVSKKTSLPHSLICWGGYDEVVITSEAKQFELPALLCPFPPLQSEFPLKVPGETALPGWRVTASIAPGPMDEEHRGRGEAISAEFDLGKTGAELFVRHRQPGDRFQPLGMSTPKKLQEFMVDAKIPLHWRERIPIVCSPQQIIWVVGWRIDDRAKITESTREILRLEFVVNRPT
jgi:tRNA(Ile)-lysidine synthase